ncbi:membrane protein [Mycolicibacterium goodii]|uniref:Membrane protein n=1 Tax=Mycolicibacterium goodii TaxID=134601 RepID=A0A0K0XGK9_MYCGD|nr:membrane protein [Mycolicibacterium goodii]
MAQLARIPVTLAYAASLVAVTAVLFALGPETQDRVVLAASTNLHNLRHGHLATLVGSAFVTDAGPMYAWLPGLMCLLAVAELMWRSSRMLLALAVGHVGATALVAIGLVVAIDHGWAPAEVSRDIDVGVSYGAAGVLGALTAAIPRSWRPVWIGWWLGVAAGVAAAATGFTDIGHVVALLLGMLLSARLGRPCGWTTTRGVLLAIASVFGLLLLASSELLIVVAPVAGAVGGVAGYAAGNAFGGRQADHL